MNDATDRQAAKISRRQFVRTTRKVAVFGGLFFLVGCGGEDDDEPTPGSALRTAFARTADGQPTASGGGAQPTAASRFPTTGTLYERLGGRPMIEEALDEFLPMVGFDPRFNFFFVNADGELFLTLLADLIGSLTGGPEEYTGRSMQDVHAGLGIAREHFDALIEDLEEALGRLSVPDQQKQELLAILGPMDVDIITA
jgi:hemoglobin